MASLPHLSPPNYQAELLKQTLQNDPRIQQLYRKLDADHLLIGAGVVYIDSKYNIVKLREFQPVCRIKPINIVIHEVPPGEKKDTYSTKLVQNQRESRLVGEAVGTLLSCGAAVLGWMVVVGGVGAVPVSGGASTAITVLAVSAALASSAQCVNGAIRTSVEASGNGVMVDQLDSQEWYQETTRALDIISLAGAGTSALAAFKAYQVAKAASSRGVLEILKGMTRAERKRMTEAIIRVNHPGVSNKLLKQMVRAGKYPTRYANSAINAALMLHVKDAVGATLSFSGSALSGTVRDFAIGVYEETQ